MTARLSMTDISRDEENAAFEKLRAKLDRLAPRWRADDTTVIMPKLTVREIKAMMQLYRRHT